MFIYFYYFVYFLPSYFFEKLFLFFYRYSIENKQLVARSFQTYRRCRGSWVAVPAFNRRMLYKVMALFSCFFYDEITILYIFRLYRIPATCFNRVITYAIGEGSLLRTLILARGFPSLSVTFPETTIRRYV